MKVVRPSEGAQTKRYEVKYFRRDRHFQNVKSILQGSPLKVMVSIKPLQFFKAKKSSLNQKQDRSGQSTLLRRGDYCAIVRTYQPFELLAGDVKLQAAICEPHLQGNDQKESREKCCPTQAIRTNFVGQHLVADRIVKGRAPKRPGLRPGIPRRAV